MPGSRNFRFPQVPASNGCKKAKSYAYACVRGGQQQPAHRQHAAIAEYSGLGRSIVRHLHGCGAWALAEQYQGCELKIAYLELHYSHPQQSWYEHCYEDVGLATSAPSYLHYDFHADSQNCFFI